jgi:16S rRNA (guanine(966)-N(2))-methyltransferase RsmD
MRIIGGAAKGRNFSPPPSLNVRPTTDRARESLFQLLENAGGLEGKRILDLFCGTGSIGLECASRGAAKVVCVDLQAMALRFIAGIARDLNWPIETTRADVRKILRKPAHPPYDYIFADPPYEAPFLPKLPQMVADAKLLQQNGLFILEHGPHSKPLPHSGLQMERTYGHVHFSFYRFG